MQLKKKLCFFFLILILSCLCFFPISKAKTTKDIIVKADADSYVYECDPSANYGDRDYLYVGHSIGENYVIIRFNVGQELSDMEVISINMKIDIFCLPHKLNLLVYITFDSWDELSVNWNNMPSDDLFVSAKEVVKKGSQLFNVYRAAAGESKVSFLVICVEEAYCTLFSRENIFNAYQPSLILKVPNGDTFHFEILIFLAITGIITLFLVNKTKG